MNDTKYNHGIDFLKNGPWDELYVLCEHWKSDLEFYKDDLRFLHHLVDKYIIWITKQENLEMVKELKVELFQMKIKGKDLFEKVGKHGVQLGSMVENPNRKDAGVIKTEHEHLEEEMAKFVKSFRENRREVFRITEYVIDSEQLANILGT